MRILQRLEKLEHGGLLTVTPPVLERFMAALDESAQRLTGAGYKSIQRESAAWDQVVEDVMSRFCRRLSRADQDRLIAELERIAGVSIDDVSIPAAGAADAVFGG